MLNVFDHCDMEFWMLSRKHGVGFIAYETT